MRSNQQTLYAKGASSMRRVLRAGLVGANSNLRPRADDDDTSDDVNDLGTGRGDQDEDDDDSKSGEELVALLGDLSKSLIAQNCFDVLILSHARGPYRLTSTL
jgi:hypothetical protein